MQTMGAMLAVLPICREAWLLLHTKDQKFPVSELQQPGHVSALQQPLAERCDSL